MYSQEVASRSRPAQGGGGRPPAGELSSQQQQRQHQQQQQWQPWQGQQQGHREWEQPPPPPPPREGATQQQQQRQLMQWGEGQLWQERPAAFPTWNMNPMQALQMLGAAGAAAYLPKGAPRASTGANRLVRLHLDQLRGGAQGLSQQVKRRTAYERLLRVGLQYPNSTTQWAAQHTHSKDLATVTMLVGDSAAAGDAARAAVASGAVTAGPFTIPVSWSRRSGPPVGCTEITLHQLPVEFVRPGCCAVLMAAAGQKGEVVEEFLGGSSLVGDAALSCPVADTVVAWVRPPPQDPLLTSLPASFEVAAGRPTAKIEVAGRVSLAPWTWRHSTEQLLQARQEVQQVVSRLESQQQQQREQQQRAQQQQQQQQGHQQAQNQGSTLQQQQQQQEQQQQQWQQRGSLPDNLYGLPPPLQQGGVGDGDTEMQDVSAAPADAQQPHHGQDSAIQRGQQQSDIGLPRAEGSWDVAMQDADAEPNGSNSWVREQLGVMLAEAVRLADDEADDPAARTLSRGDRERLERQFQQEFASTLQQRGAPPMQQLLRWLRQQLGIEELSYDSDSDSDAEGLSNQVGRTLPHSHQRQRQQPQPQKQQQQQKQKQQQPEPGGPQPLRRSGRLNLGRISVEYQAQFGPVMGNNGGAMTQLGGAGGKGNTAQPHQPLTPATATPTPCDSRRGRRR